MDKYCTGTEGVVEVRNLSKFPASSAAAAPAVITFSSPAVFVVVVAVDATDGFDDVVDEESSESIRLSISADAATATATAPGGGGGFCLADRGDGDGDSDGDSDRCPCSRCCCCCCWRRTWGG